MGKPTIYKIENDFLLVKVKDAGAELCSIYNKKTNLEYLWQAGEAWPKQAPVLFPIVGQLKDNAYRYKDKSYRMERHGFGRNSSFNLSEKKSGSIRFNLQDNASSRLQYPFIFQLNIHYQLKKEQLLVEYEVSNEGSDKMFFSIGAHPAFKVPLQESERYDDYFLKFNQQEQASRHLLKNGLIDSKTRKVLIREDTLPLTRQLFEDDALVFRNLRSDCISIRHKENLHGLDIHFRGFPYFGIWAAKGADFVCLEPWHGVADSIESTGDVETKEGMIRLNPSASFSCAFSIHPY